MGRLLLRHIWQLQWQPHSITLRVHIALLHELKRLLTEDRGEIGDVGVTAPVSVENARLVLHVTVLFAGDYAKVRIGVLVQADGDLTGDVLAEISRVVHVLHYDALLHLADVLLLNDAHQIRKSAIDGVLFESVALLDAFSHEAFAALLAQCRDCVVLDLVNLSSEGKLSHAVFQAGLTEVDSLSERTRVLCVEEQG